MVHSLRNWIGDKFYEHRDNIGDWGVILMLAGFILLVATTTTEWVWSRFYLGVVFWVGVAMVSVTAWFDRRGVLYSTAGAVLVVLSYVALQNETSWYYLVTGVGGIALWYWAALVRSEY